jgi:hypothetical protein
VQSRENIGKRVRPRKAFSREHQTTWHALEEPRREVRLENLHLMADGRLRDAQLLRGPREAQVPSRSLECAKGRERG